MITLPIDSHIPEILKALTTHQNLVIQAEPGSGKTTRIPPALVSFLKGQTLILEPRRIAAVSAALRIAEEQGFQIGYEVGYQVRFDRRYTDTSKIVFLTEALLVQKLLDNPLLIGVDCVILDEFHERSVHTDIALGLLIELQQLHREDLKIIVMSATLSTDSLQNFLPNSKTCQIPGKPFELKKVNSNKNLSFKLDDQFYENIFKTILTAVNNKETKNTLVFLPGKSEIDKLSHKLENQPALKSFEILKLHGSLSIDDQKKVIEPSPSKKIILATNIAESAITIDQVNTVIDTGLSRVLNHNFKSEVNSLELSRISKSSAKQRAGRSSRQGPGIAYQLWSQMDELSMSEFEKPAIFREDFSEALLNTFKLGASQVNQFTWFEKPPENQLNQMLDKLLSLKLIKIKNNLDKPSDKLVDSNLELTELGTILTRIPSDLHSGLLLVFSLFIKNNFSAQLDFDISNLAATVCAIFSDEKFIKRRTNERGRGHLTPSNQTIHATHEKSDLIYLIESTELQSDYKFANLFKQFKKIMKDIEIPQSKDLLKVFEYIKKDSEPVLSLLKSKEAIFDFLILSAYQDRLCKKRAPASSSCIMINGQGVELGQQSRVKDYDFFTALNLVEIEDSNHKSKIITQFVHGLNTQFVKDFFKKDFIEKDQIKFDRKSNKLTKIRNTFLHKIAIDDGRPFPLLEKELQSHLPKIIFDEWDWVLQQKQDLSQFIIALKWYLKELDSQTNQVDEVLSESWMQKFIDFSVYGINKLEDYLEKDISYDFYQSLPVHIANDFKRTIYFSLKLPSGKTTPIVFEEGQNPYIQAKIQDLLGLFSSPQIGPRKTTMITIQVLGPHYRPVQTTNDLNDFWKNSYHEIKKELKSRYPRHPWPNNPLDTIEINQYKKK